MTNPLLPGWSPRRQAAKVKKAAAPAMARSPFEVLFLAMLVMANVYNFYRYAFQINARITSPTYSDTPLWLQGGKYGLVCLYAIIILFMLVMQRRRIHYRVPTASFKFFLISLTVLTLTATALSAYALACGLPLYQAAALTHFFFIPVLLTMPLFLHSFESAWRTQWWLVFFGLGYHGIYEAIQLFLFYTTGRLPALAYKNSLVRFGGGWDDPNGAATYMALLLVAFLAYPWKRRLNQLIALGVVVGIVFFSKSFSGALAVILALVAYCLLRNKLMTLVLAGACLITAVLGYQPAKGGIHELWALKQKSTMQRLTQNTFSYFLQDASIPSILFGQSHRDWNTMTRSNEDSYLELIISFGAPFVFCLLGLLIWTLFTGWKKMRACRYRKSPRAEALFAAWTAFVFAMVVSSNFVPFLAVFPLNFFFWVVVMLIWITPLPNSQAAA